MDITTWLELEKGRLSAMADFFDVTPSAVTQWKTNGVPGAKMKAVRAFTRGCVTLDEMVSDPVPVKAQKGE